MVEACLHYSTVIISAYGYQKVSIAFNTFLDVLYSFTFLLDLKTKIKRIHIMDIIVYSLNYLHSY